MKCENCPTRICLDSPGTACPYVGVHTTRQFTFSEKLEQSRNNYLRNKDADSVPPTEKQVNLVRAYSRSNPFVAQPKEFTKRSYFEFIRDVVMKDKDFRYDPNAGVFDPDYDPDYLMEYVVQNDVWTEEY